MVTNIQKQGSWQREQNMEILFSNHRLLDWSEFLSRSEKCLHRQNYAAVKETSRAAGAHRNRKDGFASGAPRTRMNSYFCPAEPVLAPVRGHACSMAEHLMRPTKTWHVAFKHSFWWLDKNTHEENHKKLPHHHYIRLLYSAYYFLLNHALGSPHTGTPTNAADNRKACCYWENW